MKKILKKSIATLLACAFLLTLTSTCPPPAPEIAPYHNIADMPVIN